MMGGSKSVVRGGAVSGIRLFHATASWLLDLVFPALCPVCGMPVNAFGALCANCWKEIDFIDGPLCRSCGLPFEVDPGDICQCGACLAHPPAFDGARAVLRYTTTSRGPILALKHADRLDLARPFAAWVKRAGADWLADCTMEDCIIAPVPLHRWRLWRRRYNQAAEIGRHLARLTGIRFAPLALSRRRATPSQGDMPSAKARRRNVRGAFFVPMAEKAGMSGKTVFLIDDVMTTGATVDACARALKRAGAEKVLVLSVARVVRSPLVPI